MKNNFTQSMRAKSVLSEMKRELKKLKQDVSFREYIGYELCMKKFKDRYKEFLRKPIQSTPKHKSEG